MLNCLIDHDEWNNCSRRKYFFDILNCLYLCRQPQICMEIVHCVTLAHLLLLLKLLECLPWRWKPSMYSYNYCFVEPCHNIWIKCFNQVVYLFIQLVILILKQRPSSVAVFFYSNGKVAPALTPAVYCLATLLFLQQMFLCSRLANVALFLFV